jgi:hypothetical protein
LDNTAYSYWQDETGNKAIADTLLRAIKHPNGKIIWSYIVKKNSKRR